MRGDPYAAKKIHEASQLKHPPNKRHIHVILDILAPLPHKYIPFRCKVVFKHDCPTFQLDSRISQNNKLYLYVRNNIEQLPKVGIIEASDGTVGHAIGICDKWIFDSNLCHAMLLSKDNLNWCASCDTMNLKFVKFDVAYVFVKVRNNCFTRVKWDREISTWICIILYMLLRLFMITNAMWS